MKLSFPTGTWQSWRIWRSTALVPSSWVDLTGLRAGTGVTESWVDTPPAGVSAYYRIEVP